MTDLTPNLGGRESPDAGSGSPGSPIVIRMTRDGWTFVTNHGHVLVCLAADPEVLVRDVAASIGITERAVQQIIGDLVQSGVVARVRVGRRNHYIVCREQRLRHLVESGVTTGEFVDLMRQRDDRPETEPGSPFALRATGSTEGAPGGSTDWASAGHEVVAHLRSQGL